uniref:Uncharacterized protein n=1 Tax=Nelumbo nucifera TaxID=4432 RepID=A0A822Z9M7_NELNU|nr:TPA_asm: hypothetical protein HUJ06_016085 [Nelumbo nucifera]
MSAHDSSSSGQDISDRRERIEMDAIVEPFESITTIESEPSSRYL